MVKFASPKKLGEWAREYGVSSLQLDPTTGALVRVDFGPSSTMEEEPADILSELEAASQPTTAYQPQTEAEADYDSALARMLRRDDG